MAPINYDSVLTEAGGFGWFQAIVLIMYTLSIFCYTGHMGYMTFGMISPLWLPCNSTDPLNTTCVTADPEYYSLGAQWELQHGDMWIVAQAITTQMLGMLLAPPLVGILSDNHGRRKITAVCMALCAVAGIVESFCTTSISFIVVRFAVGFFATGTDTALFVMCAELFTTKTRMVLNVGSMPIGYMFGASMALAAKHWQRHLWLITCPAVPAILLIVFLPESPMWLMSTNRGNDAVLCFTRIAKTNRIKTWTVLNGMLADVKVTQARHNTQHQSTTNNIRQGRTQGGYGGYPPFVILSENYVRILWIFRFLKICRFKYPLGIFISPP